MAFERKSSLSARHASALDRDPPIASAAAADV
jgi:hypothetical protein